MPDIEKAKKDEPKPSILQKITLFKEPHATNFGGIITVLIPVLPFFHNILDWFVTLRNILCQTTT
jgi:hypothetical protein